MRIVVEYGRVTMIPNSIPGSTQIACGQKQSNLLGSAGITTNLRVYGNVQPNKLKVCRRHIRRHFAPLDLQTHNRLQLSSEYSSPIFTSSPDFLMQPKHYAHLELKFLSTRVSYFLPWLLKEVTVRKTE